MEAVIDINKLQEQYIPWIEMLPPGQNVHYVYTGNEGLRSANDKPVVKPYIGLSSEHSVLNPVTGKPYYLQYVKRWELKENGEYKPVTEHIGMSNGSIVVTHRDQNLYKFLEASDENESNPNADPNIPKKFRRVDAQKQAQAEIEKDNMLDKAKSIAKTADFEKIKAIALSYRINPENYDATELRHDLLLKAKRNPKEFLEKAKDKQESNIENLIAELTSKSVIKYADSEWSYKDGAKKETLCKAVAGEDKNETLLKYLKSREGKTVLGLLEKLVK